MGLFQDAHALLGEYGTLAQVRATAEAEIPKALDALERYRASWEFTRDDAGRREARQAELLAPAVAAEASVNEAVAAADAVAARLEAAGYEPGSVPYGSPGFNPATHRAGGERRFALNFVRLSPSETETASRVEGIIAADVAAAERAADLERMLEASLGDRGRLFAACRAIEGSPGRPTSARVGALLDEAWEQLRDPDRATYRERASELRAAARSLVDRVDDLRGNTAGAERAAEVVRGSGRYTSRA